VEERMSGQEKPTVGDQLVRRLAEWGVERIYGFAGDGINGILAALGRAGNKPTFVQPVHEELAAFMACAHAKWTGQVGVCMATSGPGAIHLLNGLYDAKLDHQPVVAIVGEPARSALGGTYQQEIDLPVLYKDVADRYVGRATEPTQFPEVLDRALRIAIAERTVTAVLIPNDLQQEPAVQEPPREHGILYSSVGYSDPRIVPEEEDLRRAAAVLNAGQRVAILVGAGALGAGDEVAAVAERLGAGVAKALLGKAALPDDLPFVTGSVGWLGTDASAALMSGCDTLLMVGSSFPYTEYLPKPGQARGVQIDRDASRLGIRYPMESLLVGDSAATLRALLPHLTERADRSWRQEIERNVADWWREADRRADQPASPINPQLVVRELSARLPDGCILTADSGTSAVWYARHLRLRRGMLASLSGTLATMGCGVPYALTAKYTHPDRPAIALVGDGAMQMLGINGLLTAARVWRDWADPRLIIVVLNNRDLNYVTWEQRAMVGFPRFAPSQEVPDFPYARYAELIGLRGIRVERPEEVGAAWDEALAADRPVILDVVVDPDVPTLPPYLTEKQEQALTKALAADPAAPGVRRQMEREGITLPAK
jgi:pyruvate dehydrogenase (quinone)